MSDKLARFISQFNPRHADAIESVLQLALEVLPGDLAQFDRFDIKKDALSHRHSRCFPHQRHDNSRLLAAVCQAEFVHGGRSSAVIEDIDQSPYAELAGPQPGDHDRFYAVCPVPLGSDAIGMLTVSHRTRQALDEHLVIVLEALTRLAGLADERQQAQSETDAKNSFRERLVESEALNEQMLQLSPVAIYRLDLVRQRFIKVNDYMCRATGYTEEEFLAMNPADLLTPKSRDLFIWRCRAMASGHPVSRDVELEVVTKGGAVEWTRFHIRHLYEDGKLTGANVVAHFITAEKNAQEELDRYRRKLEDLVQERTAEVAQTNQKLREEIAQRNQATDELRASGERLKEMNTAMRVLLDKRKEDQQQAEELIRLNLKELIDPYLERLGNSGLADNQKQLLDVIRMNLDEVVGSSMPEFSSKCYLFSPNELHVVNLIRKGKTTKEMASLLNLSVRTIESYRNSIRGKLSLKNKKINLKTYLTSI